ncbi:MAG: NFYB/HAP3 family transcription factor subunit [Candidatus Micrarchaeaceae archaeon]
MAISKRLALQILKEMGAKRVSESAASEFSDRLNKLAYRIAGKAVKLAAHAKRKTVKKSDIDLAE